MITEYKENPEVFTAGMEYQNKWDEERIIKHLGHSVEIVSYAGDFSLTIECKNCSEIIWDNGM